MNLKLVLPIKKIQINDKIISVPKFGVKQHNILNSVKAAESHLRDLLQSISPGLTAPEGELVLLHVLQFNGRLKDKEIEGHTYSVDDVVIRQILTHQFQGNVFKFKSPQPFETFASVDQMLSELLISVNDEKVDVDFMKMPAFVSKWADQITYGIALDTHRGTIKGLTNILGLFE
ncbi:phage baseplate hub [Yersinia phage phiR1-RT]|uniref:Phage baseplate hub n=1 Tax=Yersinia phage phiR1-RT TaxID=1206558 RepID=I7LH90_BPPR1|nr:baseplate hub distal subunit [Yersinia phage phiR1-RT]CCI88769.1 phage baseplate hub [Yersinia phage phiR1-RT]